MSEAMAPLEGLCQESKTLTAITAEVDSLDDSRSVRRQRTESQIGARGDGDDGGDGDGDHDSNGIGGEGGGGRKHEKGADAQNGGRSSRGGDNRDEVDNDDKQRQTGSGTDSDNDEDGPHLSQDSLSYSGFPSASQTQATISESEPVVQERTSPASTMTASLWSSEQNAGPNIGPGVQIISINSQVMAAAVAAQSSADVDPRKGFGPDKGSQARPSVDMPIPQSSTTPVSASSISTQPALADLSSSTLLPFPSESSGKGKEHHGKNRDEHGLGHTGEKVLVSFGVIGAFIILCAIIYAIARFKKIDLPAGLQNGEIRRGSKGIYGWRRKGNRLSDEAPPQYPGDKNYITQSMEILEEQPSGQPRQRLDAGHAPNPTSLQILNNKPTNEGLSPTSLIERPTLSDAAEDISSLIQPADHNFLKPHVTGPQTQTHLQQQSYLPSLTGISQIAPLEYSGNLSSQRTFLTNAAVYTPPSSQRAESHMSYISSISSGFGDAQISVPESGPILPSDHRATITSTSDGGQVRPRFSWMRGKGGGGQRGTDYVATSEEPAHPRFRSVNSWVQQQAGRVWKGSSQSVGGGEEEHVPEMPSVAERMLRMEILQDEEER